MRKFHGHCSRTGLLLIFLTALAGCQFLTNDLRNQQIPGQANVYNPKMKVGTSAHALASGTDFKTVLVEIQAVKGFTPSLESLNLLQDFLDKTLDKPFGVQIVMDDPIPSPGMSSYTILDVRNLETKYRRYFTQKDQVVVYMLFVDAPSADDYAAQRMMGQAHQNTSIVIYEKTIRDAAQPGGEVSTLETTTMEHEFGHTLGLVNAGAPVESGHEDATHPHHCTNPNCLMYFTAEQGGAIPATVPQLGPECAQDLKAIGAK